MIAIYKRSDAVKDYGIVGGKDMLTKYVVSLQIAPDGDFDKEFGFYHVCAGAIISAKLILTAATCTEKIAIKKRKVEDLLVIIGTPIRLQRGPTTQEIADYDIALLVVFQAIEIDRAFADIIPLTKWPPQRDMLCTVIGWWRVYTGGPVTDEISRTNVYIDSIKDCNQLYAVQLEQSVCITAEKLKEFGTCTGDPGGPLICEGKLYGLLSTRWDRCFGFATYASVYHHLKWLNLTNENLQPQQPQQPQQQQQQQ
ncbi:trypsin-6-like [Glossina fuscipes fuscipes]